MKKYVFSVFYINSRGYESRKDFTGEDHYKTLEQAVEFTRVLDRRIERGTCGGYSLTDSYFYD